MRTLVYMAHQLSGDFDTNIHKGNLWYRFLRSLNSKGVLKLLGGNPDKVVKIHNKVVNKEGALEQSALLVNPFGYSPVIVAPWLTCPVPDGKYPGGRRRALDDCIEMVMRADEVWFVGNKVSDGMRDEGAQAKSVRDLTHWGEFPPNTSPDWGDTDLFE